MARYSLLIKASATKEIEAIGPKKERQRIVRRIQALADNARPSGCERLTGQQRFRVRQGAYRIVYSVDDKRTEIVIVKIGHRRDVYKRPT